MKRGLDGGCVIYEAVGPPVFGCVHPCDSRSHPSVNVLLDECISYDFATCVILDFNYGSRGQFFNFLYDFVASFLKSGCCGLRNGLLLRDCRQASLGTCLLQCGCARSRRDASAGSQCSSAHVYSSVVKFQNARRLRIVERLPGGSARHGALMEWSLPRRRAGPMGSSYHAFWGQM